MRTAAIILAAGQGTRMKSDLPKVLFTIDGQPMISRIIDKIKAIGADRACVVVGYKADLVIEVCRDEPVEFVIQEEQLGTGHAVLLCEQSLEDFAGTILVLNGDVPCLRPETILRFMQFHRATGASGTVLTVALEDPTGYGRIVRDGDGSLARIVEERDATQEERRIVEINSGLFCFEKPFLFSSLREVKRENVQGEYYLTDVIAIMKKKDLDVRAFRIEDATEVAGINTIEELERVRRYVEGTER